MAMTLEPCPFCGTADMDTCNPDGVFPDGGPHGYFVARCGNPDCAAEVSKQGREETIAAWNRRAHITQPAQAVDVGLVERLRKRAAEERQIAENNARVAELLAPELARFKAGEEHNVYATRMAIDHRDSAKRDAAFADDLEMAASALAGEKAEGLPWISVDAKRPERNRPAIYWHKSEFGGFAAIADEWCDEHHLAYATHWLPYTPPTDGEE